MIYVAFSVFGLLCLVGSFIGGTTILSEDEGEDSKDDDQENPNDDARNSGRVQVTERNYRDWSEILANLIGRKAAITSKILGLNISDDQVSLVFSPVYRLDDVISLVIQNRSVIPGPEDCRHVGEGVHHAGEDDILTNLGLPHHFCVSKGSPDEDKPGGQGGDLLVAVREDRTDVGLLCLLGCED